MQRSRLGAIAAAAALLLLAASARAQSPAGQFHARIVSGVQTAKHPEVGALVISDPLGGNGYCSGVMIGCDTFITAAHCACLGLLSAASCDGSVADANNLRVYIPSAGIFKGAAVTVDSHFEFGTGADLAVIKLAEPMSGVIPARINSSARPQPGASGDLVGYGRDGKSYAVGIKRFGKVVFDTCNVVPDDNNVCWSFIEPVDVPGTDSNTCQGDSGGPLFADLGDGDVLAGITSGGGRGCHPPDESFDTDVFVYRDFVAGVAGDDLHSTRCGDLPQVGEAGARATMHTGSLSSDTRDARFTIDVPAGTSRVRVALNGESENLYVVNDFDLAVRYGAPASLQQFDCKDDSPLSYAFCEVTDPTAGAWQVLVHATEGTGKFQLTVTTFADSSAKVSQLACDPAVTKVTMDEMLQAVDMALGHEPTAPRNALGIGSEAAVTIDELIRATNAAVACEPAS